MEKSDLNIHATYRRLLRLVPQEGLAVRAVEQDYETSEVYKYSKELDRSSVIREVRDYLRKCYGRSPEDLTERLSEIRSLSDLTDLLSESYEDGDVRVMFIGSPAEAEKRKIEEERRRLEGLACQIASAHNVRLDSFEFIEILEQMISRQKSYRYGLQEDGLCIGYGVTAEQWFDEYNYSQSETSSVYNLLDFLGTHCPLLMAQYRERKLKEGGATDYENLN